MCRVTGCAGHAGRGWPAERASLSVTVSVTGRRVVDSPAVIVGVSFLSALSVFASRILRVCC